ncbi:response regulator [Cohnella xylanilytica]|uniref:Response regulator n=1 Tax=Cohnella xylanilytica TaxID=557555 RepID=A0A841U6A6_9BACL|nr:response regulator [Cohnella xylanilytica]MBB6693530.1 response regulator [Cohnella xylanilytica]
MRALFRVMIVEDERPTLELMERLIGRHPLLEVAGTFDSPLEAMERYPELKPDVAFLDVEMPKMGGIELAGKLKAADEELQVVFTTAYPGYAVDAFRVNAVDYLLKPVVPEDLERVVSRIVKNREPRAPLRRPEGSGEPPVRCLGTFETRGTDGTLLNWPTRKTEELFAYFLAFPNRLTDKWRLADLLWPDLEEGRSLHNLHNTIYRLKKTLKEANLEARLTHTNEGYLYGADPFQSDLGRLREFMARFSRIDGGNAEEAEERFRSYRGALFGGKDYPWSSAAASEAASQYAGLARMLTAWHRERGDPASTKETLRIYLDQAPLDEEKHAELLRMYADAGETGNYIRHYERFERLLEEELGIEPPEELRRLAERMR